MTEIEIDEAVREQAAEYAERLVAALTAKMALNDMVNAGIPRDLAEMVLSMSDEEFGKVEDNLFEIQCDYPPWPGQGGYLDSPVVNLDESDYSEPPLRFDDNG